MNSIKTYTSFNNYIAHKSGIGGYCLIGPTGPTGPAAASGARTGKGDTGAQGKRGYTGNTGAKGPTGPGGGGASDASLNQIIVDISNLDASMNQAFDDISANTACCERLDASMVQIFDLVEGPSDIENIFYKKPDFVIGPTGSYDTTDQRIELTWVTPSQRRVAYNFSGSPAQGRITSPFTPSFPSGTTGQSPYYPASHPGQSVLNLIVPSFATGYYSNVADEPGFSDLNYFPYHQYVGVDYSKRGWGTSADASWTPITPADLGFSGNTSQYLGEQNLWHQTRGLYIEDGTGGVRPSGDYTSNFIYLLEDNAAFVPDNNGYQFRVYITNNSEEILTPTSDDIGFRSENPPYWRYKYIPDNSNTYISFGAVGNATPPRNISNGFKPSSSWATPQSLQPTGGPVGSDTTYSPSQTYNTLIITGANNNALPFSAPSGSPATTSSDANSPADVSLNIPFGQLGTYNLSVFYSFDISGAYIYPFPTSFNLPSTTPTTPWGEQNNVTATAGTLQLTSNSIQKNSWSTLSDFGANVNANVNAMIYPGFTYYLSNYKMSLIDGTTTTDASSNMYDQPLGTGVGDSASNLDVSRVPIVIKPPSRTKVSSDYTSYLTNTALFVEGGFQNQGNTNPYSKQSSIYPANSSSRFLNPVYFFTSVVPNASHYNIILNGTRKCVNNKTNSVSGWTNGTGETIIGNDLSTFGANGGLSHFILSSVDQNSTLTTAYAGAWGSVAPADVSNSFLQLSVSASTDAHTGQASGAEYDRLHGWYMGIDVINADALGVNLINYPDIAIRNSQPIGGNDYNPYIFTLAQQIDTNTSGAASDTPVGAQAKYDLYIAEIEPPITWAPTQHPGVTILQTPEFFGLNRPLNSNIATSGFAVSGTLNDISQRWRPELTLMDGEIKYYTSSSNAIQLQNASKTFTAPWNTITTPAVARRSESINKVVQVAKSDLQIATMNYSRDSTFIPQFAATGDYRNNVANTPLLQTYSYEFYFTPSVPNGTLLWWDYTMSSLTIPFNYTLSKPGSGGTGSSLPTSGGGAWMPINSTVFFSTYDHTVTLPNNQLMWANGGFRGAGTTGSNDPYIDFTTYHGQIKNYSSLKSQGENDTITYIPYGVYYRDNPFNSNPVKSISGTYKWINLMDVKSLATTKYLNVTVQNGSSTLTLGTDYMLLVCEKTNSFTQGTESPYSNRSGWKDAARAFDSSLSGSARNANGTGINTFQYLNASSTPPANGGPLNIFKDNLAGLEIYLRIGLSNSSTNTITNVSVSFTI